MNRTLHGHRTRREHRSRGAERRNCESAPVLDGALALMAHPDAADEFEAFYRQRAQDARRYAAAILAQRAPRDLDDALQNAWARAWKAWDQADPQRREAWFFRIVRNCCLDVHRRSRPTEPLEEHHLPAVDLVEPVVERLDAGRALEALTRLKPHLREALWLREVGELTYAEIAEVQDVPIGTVMSRLHTARRRMVRMLRRGQ